MPRTPFVENAMMDESYRSFAFIAACLTVLHFVLPVVTTSPSCSDSIAVIVSSATLVSLGSVYSLGFLIWVYTTSSEDFFTYEVHSDGPVKKRSPRARPAEDARFMTFLWMAIGATGLLSNDLIWAARYILKNPNATDKVQIMWVFWIALSIILAIFAALSSGHLLSMGAEAQIEAAEGMLRRVDRVRTKAIKLQ